MDRKASSDNSHKQASPLAQIPFDPEAPTDSVESLSVHVSTGRGRSSMHGDSYQLRLGMVILLRAFKMYQEERDFDFVIAMEDPVGKDFDDIMYHYRSPRLSEGTVSVQAKHKRTEQNKKSMLTEGMLLAPPSSNNSSFSIPKYFLSFLEVDQQLKTDTHTFVLCTNAVLEESLEKCLMVKRDRVDDGLQFCYDIGATCYQINRITADKKLKEALIDSCALEVGRLMAKQVMNGTEITFKSSLYCAFASLINKYVQSTVVVSNNELGNNFKFKEGFFNALKSSAIGKFRTGFSNKYRKLVKDDNLDVTKVMKEAVLKIDTKSFSSAIAKEEHFDRKLEKFYESFVLVCNSLNEDELYRKGIDMLPNWCNSEVVIDMLHTLLFDAIKSKKPIPIDLTFVKRMFIEKNVCSNTNCAQLRNFSEDYIKSLRLKYPHIELNPEILRRSRFSAFLQDVAADEVYEFNSQLDVTVSSLIVTQTLSVYQWETLFVHSTKYEETQDMTDILDDLLSYLRDVNHPTIKVITIVGKPNYISFEEVKKLSKRYNRKIVVVEKISENQQKDKHCEKFAVHDLTQEASCQMFKDNDKIMIFGTVTPLSKIVEESDDLCFLIAFLDSYVQSSEINGNLNKYNYEQITHWYIHRHYEPNNDETPIGNVAQHVNLNLNNLPYSKEERVPFAKMAKFIDGNNNTIAEVQRVLDMSEEDPVPPGFQKGEIGKVFIFLNDAGHGKTSYFTWLAWRLAKQDRAQYVVKLNAIEYLSDFERLECLPAEWNGVQNIDYTGTVRLLYRLVHLALFVPGVHRRTMQEADDQRSEADKCAKLLTFINGLIVLDEMKTKELTTKQLIELRLFRAKFNEQQLVLILDGFDEIAPNYKDVVMHCFERFAKFKGIRNIYLSSRPCDFEKEFTSSFNNCNMNRLKPFSRDNVILSLHKFLLNNVDDYKDCETEQCKYVLTVLYIVVTAVLSDLTTVPLLLGLAQGNILPVVREHINFKLYTISKHMLMNAKFGTMQLVEHFIDRKLRILNTDKCGTTDTAIKSPVAKKIEERSNKHVRERHVLLAMCVIFDKNDRDKLLSTEDQERVTEFIEEVIAGEEKTGLIEGIRGGVPQFVHRIFAEYFAACWLSKNRKRFQSESVFRSQVIWTYSLEKMRDFFNRMILKESEGCDLHWAVLNKSIQQVRQIVYANPDALAVKDNVGRLPLHFAHSCWIYEEVLSIEELFKLGHETDDLFQWNALDYAFIQNDGLEMQQLLKWGVRPNEEILFQQLYSNDTENLFLQGIDYVFHLKYHGKKPAVANAICTRLVKHLINERKLDIYSPLKNLKSLSALEGSVACNVLEMFHQLITQSGQPEQVLDGLVDRLFQLAFERKAHDIITYLVERCSFPLPWINDYQSVVEGAKRAIEKGQLNLFKMIFRQLCIRQKFVYVEENDIIDEIQAHSENNMIETDESFENECCVLSSNNVNLSLPELSFLYDFDTNVDEIVLEFLLTRAIHVGSVQIASYILQTTKMVVTNRLIVTIMRLLPKSQPFCHKTSMPAFRYLLNKTVDLHSVDQEGRNLFHMVAQNGCFYMLPCLIAKGFDPKQNNVLNHWNGFHYLASCTDKFSSRVFNAFAFFQQLGHVDGFETLSTTGENVFDIAIANEHNKVAQMLVQAQNYNLSCSGKVDAVMDIMQRMLLKYDANRVFEFLYCSYMNTTTDGLLKDEMWHAVYTSIIKKVIL